ncbi:MAG: GTP 3',8-cyclase MoaA [Phycisphaerae bacterium]
MSTLALPIFDAAPDDASAALAAAAQGPRDIRYVKTLRISVTDHCNFRCIYCMPEEGVEWLPKHDLLTYEEIVEIARAAMRHGVRDFKLTGGEPLLRKDLDQLVRMLRELPGTGEISLTTNGLLLDLYAGTLRAAGLNRVTVSIDTLNPAKFRAITRTGDLDRVWAGIEVAEAAGLGPAKINVVVMRNHNEDEIADFARLTLTSPRTIRFIEFMPLADSKLLAQSDALVPYDEMRRTVEDSLGPLEPASRDVGNGPANVFHLAGASGRIGFIHAMSAPFCSTCNRLRLTPEGRLRSCLFDGGEVDVRPLVRPRLNSGALHQAFLDCVVLKPDVHRAYGTRQMSRIGG